MTVLPSATVIAGVEYQVAADALGADAAIAPARPTVTPPAARILAHDRAVRGDLKIFTVPLVPVAPGGRSPGRAMATEGNTVNSDARRSPDPASTAHDR